MCCDDMLEEKRRDSMKYGKQKRTAVVIVAVHLFSIGGLVTGGEQLDVSGMPLFGAVRPTALSLTTTSLVARITRFVCLCLTAIRNSCRERGPLLPLLRGAMTSASTAAL